MTKKPINASDNNFYNITRDVSSSTDNATLIRNIWTYIYRFTSREDERLKYDEQVMIAVLNKVIEIVRSEPTVLNLKEKVNIVGDIHGHGDSLVTFMSIGGIPPMETYLFLGNYAGEGFAPHETLFLLIAMKIRYPRHVYLLKGCLEDEEVLSVQDFVSGLIKRGLSLKVWDKLAAFFYALPLAAVIGKRHFCVHGGIGPMLLRYGVRRLRRVRRPACNPIDVALTMVRSCFASSPLPIVVQECQWACLRASTLVGDGSPLFDEEDIDKFCAANHFLTIIRSRQIVREGVLNMPAKLLTVWSATGYLDMFRNYGATLKLDPSTNTAVVIRYKLMEDEPKSLDDKRPMSGRNARAL